MSNLSCIDWVVLSSIGSMVSSICSLIMLIIASFQIADPKKKKIVFRIIYENYNIGNKQCEGITIYFANKGNRKIFIKSVNIYISGILTPIVCTINDSILPIEIGIEEEGFVSFNNETIKNMLEKEILRKEKFVFFDTSGKKYKVTVKF